MSTTNNKNQQVESAEETNSAETLSVEEIEQTSAGSPETETPVEGARVKVPSRIYLGPNLPGGRLLQSTVFRGGIPKYLEQLLKEQTDVAALIVPVEELSAVQARILQKGTAEYVAYQAILGKEQ